MQTTVRCLLLLEFWLTAQFARMHLKRRGLTMAEYIEREELMKFPIRRNYYDKEHGNEHFIYGIETVLEYAENLPAADVAPVRHGRWVPIRESEMTGWDPAVAGRDPIGGYICSACKEEAVYDCNDEFVLSKYCPNCGVKMG